MLLVPCTYGTPHNVTVWCWPVRAHHAVPTYDVSWLGWCKGADSHRTKLPQDLWRVALFFVPKKRDIFMSCFFPAIISSFNQALQSGMSDTSCLYWFFQARKLSLRILWCLALLEHDQAQAAVWQAVWHEDDWNPEGFSGSQRWPVRRNWTQRRMTGWPLAFQGFLTHLLVPPKNWGIPHELLELEGFWSSELEMNLQMG